MSRRLTIRPGMRVKDRKTRVYSCLLPIPVHERFCPTTMQTCVIIFREGLEEVIFGLFAPQVTCIRVLQVAVTILLPRSQGQRHSPSNVIVINLVRVRELVFEVFHPSRVPFPIGARRALQNYLPLLNNAFELMYGGYQVRQRAILFVSL